jgi:hypothetical protein
MNSRTKAGGYFLNEPSTPSRFRDQEPVAVFKNIQFLFLSHVGFILICPPRSTEKPQGT